MSNVNEVDHERLQYMAAIGNWEIFHAAGLDLDMIRAAAHDWRAELDGVGHGWLCWNVNDDWCLVQQKIVQSFGWTPIVGFDPRVGPPKELTSQAMLVDFNKRLQLPNLFFYIPLEFAFLFCKKLCVLALRPTDPAIENAGIERSFRRDQERRNSGHRGVVQPAKPAQAQRGPLLGIDWMHHRKS
ncbi:hypothetical protein [Salinisphaera sp. LB1]|uniref:hypothetical protein n=1 Tax=Salinisphaera sp. LB1 TaxID=2183911 RepID=UPI000D7055C1|nr:hypothetical protein [Salinisphaera sp. LB1]